MLTYGQQMKVVYNFFNYSTIRLGSLLSLIFFGLLLTACQQNKKEEIEINWNDKKATGIIIPKSLLTETDSLSSVVKIRLENEPGAMLGEYSETNDKVLFKPLVPLSPGLNYEIFFKESLLGKIAIPSPVGEAAKLVAVYPSADTLPENLLKLYFQFSAPMREGEALQHISLTDSDGDTLTGTFLDLKPELWNKERTVLTVWLDPGRIKRDLVPNQELGNPLIKGKEYILTVSNHWKDIQNLPMKESHSRKFVVTTRDSKSPLLQDWKIDAPTKGTVEPLRIIMNEPLDYFLLQETLSIFNEKGIKIAGNFKIVNKETSLEFIPASPWQAGLYRLQVATYLEDLAGNNLQRPFDRDVRANKTVKNQDYAERNFVIE